MCPPLLQAGVRLLVLNDLLVRLAQNLEVTGPDLLQIGQIASPPFLVDLHNTHGDILDQNFTVLSDDIGIGKRCAGVRIDIAGDVRCGHARLSDTIGRSFFEEMLKALPWFGQMDGYNLTITAVDLQRDAADRFAFQCPELC